MIIVNFIKKAGHGFNRISVVGIVDEELDLMDDHTAIKSAINAESIKENGIYRISLARTSPSLYEEDGFKPTIFKVVSVLKLDVNTKTRKLEYNL